MQNMFFNYFIYNYYFPLAYIDVIFNGLQTWVLFAWEIYNYRIKIIKA